MALVRRVGRTDVAVERKGWCLCDLVPTYEWETTSGESREGLKLHYISFLPEGKMERSYSPPVERVPRRPYGP